MPAETTGGFRRAQRIDGMGLSEIVKISEKAQQLRAEGRDVIALSTGEPDSPTPDHVIEAAHKAALSGQTRYPPTAGVAALRDAIAARAGASRENVIISTGAKQVLANAMLATLEPGDEVVVPAPYWSSYPDIVRLSGGAPVFVSCPASQGFKITPALLEQAITPRTRWLMLNSPSNPTGAVYTVDEYAALAAVLERYPHVWIVSDEIYEHLTFGSFTSFAAASPDLRERTLVVNGVSKAWSMTGWRIGWGIGPPALIAAMVGVQGQTTSGASSISQAAALAALVGDETLLYDRRTILRARRDRVVSALNAMPVFDCPKPDGAFYVFPSCQKALSGAGGEFRSDTEFCAWLLDAAEVAVAPGSAFGLAGHIRLSYSYSETELDKGLSRISDALERTV